MRVRSLVVASLAATLLVPCLPQAQSTQRSKKRGKKAAAAAQAAAAWLLPDASPAPNAKDLERRFPGAGAVVVLDAIQHEWLEDHQLTRLQRRLRFLTDEGAREHALVELFVPEAAGAWIVWDGQAQLVKADGSATPLDAVKTEVVDGGLRISVKAEGAAAGDLVDLSQELESKVPAYPPWTAQGLLPVLESRVITIPPPIVTVRAYGANLPEKRLEPTAFDHGDLQAAGWRFPDLPALSGSAMAPPAEESSGRLLLAIESYPDLATGEILQLDWPAWGELAAQSSASWTEPALAKSLAAQAKTPAAVLSLLRGKLRVTRAALWPASDSAQAALDAGTGTSADLAMLAAAVLQAAGVEDVELVAVRPLSRGPVAAVAPVDGNFTEVLVRAGAIWLDPSAGGGAGALPARFHGTLHAPLDGPLKEPLAFPELSSQDNRLERKAKLTLSAEGRLSGISTWTWSPVAAALAGSEATSLERPVDRSDWARREGAAMDFGVLPWRVLQDLDLDGAPPAGLIHLGFPRTVVDEIAVDLPSGVTGAKLCAPASIDAGPAGTYERTVKPDGRTVTVTRTFRLDVTRFGPDEAEALFTWLRRIRDAEQAVTKLQLQ